MDISDLYLGTPMEHPEYMQTPLMIIPQEIIDHYNLNKIVTDGWVYQTHFRWKYVIPIPGRISNKLLTKKTSKAWEHVCQFTQGLRKHVWCLVTFTLVVDDVGVMFVGKRNAQYLQKQHLRNTTA